jgi:hypothetical protein
MVYPLIRFQHDMMSIVQHSGKVLREHARLHVLAEFSALPKLMIVDRFHANQDLTRSRFMNYTAVCCLRKGVDRSVPAAFRACRASSMLSDIPETSVSSGWLSPCDDIPISDNHYHIPATVRPLMGAPMTVPCSLENGTA